MVRGILFAVMVWVIVSGGIFIFSGLAKDDKAAIMKCILYGSITAVVSAGVVAAMVISF